MRHLRPERWALIALIVLFLSGVSCWFPASWSPDSQRVILPVLSDEAVVRLVISDLSGNLVREVAKVETEKDHLSPAAWSPDGKWIAYLRFKEGAAPDEAAKEKKSAPGTWSLALQEAASGRERIILQGEAPEKDDGLLADALYGPQWTRGSEAIAMYVMSKNEAVFRLLDLSGQVLQEVPVNPAGLAYTVLASPDGKHTAYEREVGAGEQAKTALYVRDFAGRAEKEIAVVLSRKPRDKDVRCRPAWSPDSAHLYFSTLEGSSDGGRRSSIKRYDPRTGKTETIWSKQDAGVLMLSVSREGPWVGLEYTQRDFYAVEVVSPGGDEPVLVHLAEEPLFGLALSPDGKWVALAHKGERNEPYPALIVSADGRALRWFFPDPKAKGHLPEIARRRLNAALTIIEFEKEFRAKVAAADLNKLNATDEEIQAALAIADQMAARYKSPVLQEAITYGKILFLFEALEMPPAAGRARFAAAAQSQLAQFMKAYPDHPLGPELQQKLDELLKEPAQPPRPALLLKEPAQPPRPALAK